ncbi:MAG: hypothetical protein AABZ11_00095 [Nitrospinota bacterium]
MKNLIRMLLLILFLASCGGGIELVKTDLLKPEKVHNIKIKVTTKDEIIKIFGEPINKLNVKGKEQFFYKDENLKSLWIEFDTDGKVYNYIYSKK